MTHYQKAVDGDNEARKDKREATLQRIKKDRRL